MNEGPILIVEDNPDEAELLHREIERNTREREVVVADDGERALNYLFGIEDVGGFKNKSIPSIIFLDLKLPRVDGFQVLRKIRAERRTRFIPVIVFTGSDNEADIDTVYRIGGNSFIQKPLNLDRFRHLVSHILEYWLCFNMASRKTRDEW